MNFPEIARAAEQEPRRPSSDPGPGTGTGSRTRPAGIPARIIPGRIPAQDLERNDARSRADPEPPPAGRPSPASRSTSSPPPRPPYKRIQSPGSAEDIPGGAFLYSPAPSRGRRPPAPPQLIIILLYYVLICIFPYYPKSPGVFPDQARHRHPTQRQDPESITPKQTPQPRPRFAVDRHGDDTRQRSKHDNTRPRPAPRTPPSPRPPLSLIPSIHYYLYLYYILFPWI